MPDRHLDELRTLTGESVHITLNALAERAGEAGAKKAVRDSFFLLGVDLEDKDSIDEFRDSMRHMRNMVVASQERKSEFRKSAIGAGFSMVAGIVAAVVTTLFLGAGKAATIAGTAASIAQHLPSAH
jgi:hypothetical protein